MDPVSWQRAEKAAEVSRPKLLNTIIAAQRDKRKFLPEHGQVLLKYKCVRCGATWSRLKIDADARCPMAACSGSFLTKLQRWLKGEQIRSHGIITHSEVLEGESPYI